MRILWIGGSECYVSNHKVNRGYNGGSWVASVQKEIVKHKNITLGIAFCMDDEPPKVVQEGVTYYPVPNHSKSIKDKIIDFWKINDVTRDKILWPYYEERFKKIIDDFKPDVIHIFGSELYQNLAALIVSDIPTILHIQGLLSLCIYVLLPPGFSRRDFIMSGRGLKGKFHNIQFLTYWYRSVYREKTILKAVSNVIGRTDWDRQAMKILNPNAKYYYGGEILRNVFYKSKDRIIPRITTITTIISFPLYKGFDVILKVADILKNELNIDFQWYVFGNVDPHFIEKQVGLRHQDLNVYLKGVASAELLCETLLNSTLYFHSSYVENSPNSVAEAQLTGIPVVASQVGGTASMVEHGKTGFLYPVTDPYMAAYYIKQLIDDCVLNKEMGEKAKQIALERHDPQKIVYELLQTYKKIK